MRLVAGARMPAFSDVYLVFKNPFCSLLFSSLFQPSNRRPGETAPLLITPRRDPCSLGAGQRGGVVRARMESQERGGAQEKCWKSNSVVVISFTYSRNLKKYE